MIELIKYLLENYPVPIKIVYSVMMIGVVLVLWHYARHTKIAQDIFNLFSFVQNHAIKKLDLKIDSEKYSDYEISIFKYKRKVLSYQKDLKTTETHLPTLIFLDGYENSKLAVNNFENASKFLIFNDEKNKFELKENFSEKYAKGHERTGGIVFFINGMIAYFIMMAPILFFEKSINSNNVIPIVIILFCLMMFWVYMGAKFFKYKSKRSNALSLLNMKRVNVKYEENIAK
ncbi:hypothetical protein [Acinetobacter bereziniae]|uniref:hypothetical protein n=1 Tax=Acinetobacter bereziniae TaxID=106648 RepID=UPI0030098858